MKILTLVQNLSVIEFVQLDLVQLPSFDVPCCTGGLLDVGRLWRLAVACESFGADEVNGWDSIQN